MRQQQNKDKVDLVDGEKELKLYKTGNKIINDLTEWKKSETHLYEIIKML